MQEIPHVARNDKAISFYIASVQLYEAEVYENFLDGNGKKSKSIKVADFLTR